MWPEYLPSSAQYNKNQIYVTIIIMVTIAIWMTQNYPYPQSSLFWADNLRPYRAKYITRCFSLGDYFSHTFAMRSVTCVYIFWPSIPPKGIYLIIIFILEWYRCIHGYIFFYLWHTYSINPKWLPHSSGFPFEFLIKLHGFKYDPMILGSH